MLISSCQPASATSAARPHIHAVARMLLVTLAALLLGACADTRYYWQSVSGHLQLMQAARPVADLLSNQETPAALKERLL